MEKLDDFTDCNDIQYAAYRTAAKLYMLQKTFHLQRLRLGLISGIFYKYKFLPTENEKPVSKQDLLSVVKEIYNSSIREAQLNLDVHSCVENMITFISDIYSNVKVLDMKAIFTILCAARIQEKYLYLFNQLADHNNCLSKKKFKLLLETIIKLMEYISESTSFGSAMINTTVDSCFLQAQGTFGVTEAGFIMWMLTEPKLLVWLSTLHRLQISERVIHNIKCDVCKTYPIIGLRYKCVCCISYNQCQNCFFTGKISKQHKLRHIMQEYCLEVSSKEATSTFFKVLKNKFLRKSSRFNQRYNFQYLSDSETCVTPVMHSSAENIDRGDQEKLLDVQNIEKSSSPIFKLIHPQEELQSIITCLEERNMQFQQEVDKLCSNNGNAQVKLYVKRHKKQVEEQIERLKSLQHFLHQKCKKNPNGYFGHLESTPITTYTSQMRKDYLQVCDINGISPITTDMEQATYAPKSSSNKWKSDPSNDSYLQVASPMLNEDSLPSLSEYSLNDISSKYKNNFANAENCQPKSLTFWLQDSNHNQKENTGNIQRELDDILDKLQKVLASNFSFEDSFGGVDNSSLQKATVSVENLITGLIEELEEKKKSNKIS